MLFVWGQAMREALFALWPWLIGIGGLGGILYGSYALIQGYARKRNPRRGWKMLSRHWENLDKPRMERRLTRDLKALSRKTRGWR